MRVLLVVVLGLAASMVMAQDVAEPHVGKNPEERRDVADVLIADQVRLGGLIEVEAYSGDEGEGHVNGVSLATLEVGLDVQLKDDLSARALLLWEEGEGESVEVDEAVLSMGLGFGISLEAGRMYVPFGKFNSHFVSDPLVLQVGETRKTAVKAGWNLPGAGISAAVCSGGVSDEEETDSVVVALEIFPHSETLSGGLSWISDLGASDYFAGMSSEEEGVGEREEEGDTVLEGAQGGGVYASFCSGRVMIEAEVVAALGRWDCDIEEGADRPLVWNCEAAFLFAGNRLELAGKFEGARDMPELPEEQTGLCVSFRLAEKAVVAVEYLHGRFEDESERDMVTGQMAYEF